MEPIAQSIAQFETVGDRPLHWTNDGYGSGDHAPVRDIA